MVKSIHIQNFRCFEDFQLDGFGRVNLIGGMNNSGKTVLLEGLLLLVEQQPSIVVGLKDFRHGEEDYWRKEAKSVFWDDLFFNKDKSRVIRLEGELKADEKIGALFNINTKGLSTDEKLGISYFNNQQEYYKGEVLLEENPSKLNMFNIVDEKYEENKRGNEFRLNIMLTRAPANTRKNLVNGFSKLDLLELSNYVLEGFQVIDSSIIEVKIVSINEPNLYLKRENEPLMPIELFGDAITKLARMVLGIILQKDGAILIDEIENGIHYANQPQVWELIFKLSNKFNVQVFATTHSKEMIQAFNKVALDGGFEDDAKYIEMARHYKTKRIIGTVLEANILKHKLEHNQPFRGE